MPLREETLPIHDIKVTFRDYAIKRIHLEPHGKELELKKGPGGAIEVRVSKLSVHAMVIVELG